MELTEHDKEILQAVIDGKGIEVLLANNKFEPCNLNYLFCSLAQEFNLSKYRVKPETITIGGMEVPKPLSVEPEFNACVFFVDPTYKFGFSQYWNGSIEHCTRLERGLVQVTEEGMIQHAKALIKISGGSYE